MTASTAASSFSRGIVVASVGNRMTRRAGDRRRTPGTGDFRADIRFFADFLPRDLISQIVTRRAFGAFSSSFQRALVCREHFTIVVRRDSRNIRRNEDRRLDAAL